MKIIKFSWFRITAIFTLILLTKGQDTCLTPHNLPGYCVWAEHCPPIKFILNNLYRNRSDTLFIKDSHCDTALVNKKYMLKMCCDIKVAEPGCILPEYPEKGNYTVNGVTVEIGANVPISTILTYECEENYIPHPQDATYCQKNVMWDKNIICEKPCKNLNSDNVELNCQYEGIKVSCNDKMRNNTIVNYKCKSGYVDEIMNSSNIIRCIRGNWDNTLPKCIEPDFCELSTTVGDCDNYTIRWYYNSSDNRCFQFYYGGCGGNQNNFMTENECKTRCVDNFPRKIVYRFDNNKTDQIVVPVTVNLTAEKRKNQTSYDLIINCTVSGYPIPDIYWFRNDSKIEENTRIQILEKNQLIIYKVKNSDTGMYRCDAANIVNNHTASTFIFIETNVTIFPENCKDNSFFSNCKLITRGRYCNHKYYKRFCCVSCVLAGQVSLDDIERNNNN